MLQAEYDLSIVAVSVLVAILASYTALSMAERMGQAKGRAAAAWIVGGGLAMGTGIWAMHFVGMLALRLPIPLGYDLKMTVGSWLLPVVVSCAALWQVGRPNLGARHLVISALLMGAGINLMHYLGMAAMRMQPAIQWDPMLVATSVVIAVCAAGTSLWIAVRLRHGGAAAWRARSLAALVMGLAIVGMHYTGMAAASFPVGSVCVAANSGFTLSGLATLVALGTAAVLAIALITSVYDARLEARNRILALTQQAAAQRELLLQREQAARTEVERLSDLKDQFLATLSHELRTPLHAVLGWVQVLRLKRDEATIEKGLQTIERNARLQSQLIDDLLDMSRIVTGKVRLEPSLINLVKLVRATVETVSPAAHSKGVRLAFAEPSASIEASGDPGRLQQVLSNLLSNAVKFTSDGGQVTVAMQATQSRAVIRVSDSGIGIDPEFLPHVFDRFQQADGSTTRRHGGLGLGLSIVRQLVELHGGTVTAESAGPGCGAVFTVELPIAHESSGSWSGRGDAEEAPAGVPTDLSDCLILVVDDEPDARALAQEMLGTCGARVNVASDAEAALVSLEQETPDVLICDIGMPVVDGFELMRRIRSAPGATATVPALALTAFTRPEDRERALRAGFDAFLQKPVNASTLAGSVAALWRGSVKEQAEA